MAHTYATLVSGMRALEAALTVHLSSACDDFALKWIPSWEPTMHPVNVAPPSNFKIWVLSPRASVAALLSREQLEACAAGIAHPDLIALVLECIVAMRHR